MLDIAGGLILGVIGLVIAYFVIGFAIMYFCEALNILTAKFRRWREHVS